MQESITTRKTCGNLRSAIFEFISPMLAKEGIWFRWLADNPVVKFDLMQQKLGKNYFFCIQARTSLEMDGTLNSVSLWSGVEDSKKSNSYENGFLFKHVKVVESRIPVVSGRGACGFKNVMGTSVYVSPWLE